MSHAPLTFAERGGPHDGFVIIDAPDEATVTAMLLAAIAPGHLRATKTTVLMRPETMVEAIVEFLRLNGGARL